MRAILYNDVVFLPIQWKDVAQELLARRTLVLEDKELCYHERCSWFSVVKTVQEK
jgi:hypothetical protein